jgi:hypothetical protein
MFMYRLFLVKFVVNTIMIYILFLTFLTLNWQKVPLEFLLVNFSLIFFDPLSNFPHSLIHFFSFCFVIITVCLNPFQTSWLVGEQDDKKSNQLPTRPFSCWGHYGSAIFFFFFNI